MYKEDEETRKLLKKREKEEKKLQKVLKKVQKKKNPEKSIFTKKIFPPQLLPEPL